MGSDETATDKAILAYESYTEEVKNILNRISTHTYGSDKIKELGALMKNENRNLWMSETDWGDVSGENAGEMGAAAACCGRLPFENRVSGMNFPAQIVFCAYFM